MFPVAATFVVARMVGWLLILSGLVTIWDAFTVEGTGAFFGELLIGLLKLALGVYLLRHPDVSIVALTLLLAAVFMIDGAVQLAMAFELRPLLSWDNKGFQAALCDRSGPMKSGEFRTQPLGRIGGRCCSKQHQP